MDLAAAAFERRDGGPEAKPGRFNRCAVDDQAIGDEGSPLPQGRETGAPIGRQAHTGKRDCRPGLDLDASPVLAGQLLCQCAVDDRSAQLDVGTSEHGQDPGRAVFVKTRRRHHDATARQRDEPPSVPLVLAAAGVVDEDAVEAPFAFLGACHPRHGVAADARRANRKGRSTFSAETDAVGDTVARPGDDGFIHLDMGVGGLQPHTKLARAVHPHASQRQLGQNEHAHRVAGDANARDQRFRGVRVVGAEHEVLGPGFDCDFRRTDAAQLHIPADRKASRVGPGGDRHNSADRGQLHPGVDGRERLGLGAIAAQSRRCVDIDRRLSRGDCRPLACWASAGIGDATGHRLRIVRILNKARRTRPRHTDGDAVSLFAGHVSERWHLPWTAALFVLSADAHRIPAAKTGLVQRWQRLERRDRLHRLGVGTGGAARTFRARPHTGGTAFARVVFRCHTAPSGNNAGRVGRRIAGTALHGLRIPTPARHTFAGVGHLRRTFRRPDRLADPLLGVKE